MTPGDVEVGTPTCTCGHIKPYGYGPHVCVGDEPEEESNDE